MVASQDGCIQLPGQDNMFLGTSSPTTMGEVSCPCGPLAGNCGKQDDALSRPSHFPNLLQFRCGSSSTHTDNLLHSGHLTNVLDPLRKAEHFHLASSVVFLESATCKQSVVNTSVCTKRVVFAQAGVNPYPILFLLSRTECLEHGAE